MPQQSKDPEEDEMMQDETTPLMPPSPSLRGSLRLAYYSPSTGRRDIKKKNKISPQLRWLTNGMALVCVFFFSGIIFGWAPLKLLLRKEGQYGALCDDNVDGSGRVTCVLQMTHFNRIFTVAQFLLSFASLPVGFMLDNAPKTLHYSVAAVLEVAGLISLATADATTEDDDALMDGFVVGYALLALGGSMAMLGAFPASFLLPKYQGGILAAVSCLFDASSIVFAVFGVLHDAQPTLFSRQNLFLGYAAFCVVAFGGLIACWATLESLDWQTVAKTDKNDKGEDDDLVDPEDDEGTDQTHARRIKELGLHEWPLLKQLTTLDFLVVLVFASVHMLRCNFYIETVNEVLLEYGDYDAKYANVFGFVLPVGVVFVPFIDATVRKFGVVKTLHFTNGLGVLFGALLLVPSLYVQAFNFVVFTCFRAYLYATLNTFIAVTFGVRTMGRVIGCAFTTAAIVTLLQYPAATLAEDICGGDFTLTHTILLGAAGLPIAFGMYYSHVVQK